MKPAKTDAHRLLKSFYKLLFRSLGASVFLSYFIFFIPLNASFVREQENYFRNEVKIKASSSDHLILDLIAGAESLGSRTVIKRDNDTILGCHARVLKDGYPGGKSVRNSHGIYHPGGCDGRCPC